MRSIGRRRKLGVASIEDKEAEKAVWFFRYTQALDGYIKLVLKDLERMVN